MEAISLYIYLVDNSFYLIIVYNNTNRLIILFKYLRLGIVSEIKYNNYYLISLEKVDLTILE